MEAYKTERKRERTARRRAAMRQLKQLSKTREIAESKDPEKVRENLIRAHEEKQGPLLAAGSFRIDDVIDPRETRPLVIKVLELGRRRRGGSLGPRYKHGIMP